jgi:aminoglycoside phosphotransferase (APT) family kinase protein
MPDLSSPIATGRTAEIFPWGDGRVLKLFRPGFYPGLADQEWANTLAAWQLGAPVPKPIALTEVEGRRGVVIERIEGTTLARCMQTHLFQLANYARLLARAQAKVHDLCIPQFPSLIERARHNISASGLLDPELKDRLLAKLDTFTEGDQVCHGDFHPENILITPKGPVVIDWEGCMRGNPSADIAITRLWFRTAELFSGTGLKGRLICQYVRAFERIYLAEYNQVAAAPARDQPAWTAIVTAMRLGDELRPLLNRILPVIEQGLTA